MKKTDKVTREPVLEKTGHRLFSGRILFLVLLLLFIACLFVASLVSPTNAAALPTSSAPKRVLLISSYSPSFPTFFEQINGVKSIFDPEKILLDVEFMDQKRFGGEDSQHLFHRQLAFKLARTKPYDLILSADDAALLYLLRVKNELFPTQPLVFFGVNNIATARAQNARNDVTGVIEAVSMRETLQLMLDLQPETQTILALVDDTPSGQGDLATFWRVARHFPQLDCKSLNLGEYNFADFAQQLQAIDSKTAVLLLSAYVDVTGQRMVFGDSLQLILQNLQRPLFHLWYHGLGDGILGGKVISHFEQGKTAAQMALRILQGTPAGSIPVADKSPNVSIIDYQVLKRFALSEKNLPQDVHFLHRPISLYQQHRAMVWGGLFFFILQSGIIVILVLTLKKNRKAQLALAESEGKYASFFNNNHSVIYLIHPKTGKIEDINPAACTFYGYSREELVGQPVTFFNPRPMSVLLEDLESCVQGRCSLFHFQHRTADGQLRDVEIHAGPVMVGGQELLCSIVHDITERIQAEQAVRERELFLDAILRTTAEGFVVLDANGFIIEVNDAYCAMIGYDEKELIGRHMSTIDIYESSEDIANRCQQIRGKGNEWFMTDHQRKDGSTISLEISVTFVEEKGGKYVSFCRDLTERNMAEQNLRRALKQTQIITTNLQLGLLLVNAEENIEFVNQTFCDYLDFTEAPEELIGMTSEDMLYKISQAFADPPLERERVRALIAQNILIQNDEFQLKNKRTMLRDLVPVVIDGTPYGRLWYLNDITELRQAIDAKKRLEQQLIQAQKMEAIGTLAGGIAHDFNNILGAVIGYAEMAHNETQPGTKIGHHLEMVLDAAQRATDLVRQILAFSRQGAAEPVKVEPATIVKEAVKLIRSTIPSTITIETHLKMPPLLTMADPVQLQQVVLNLCTNAFHAMEKTGGSLTLSLRECFLSAKDLHAQPQVAPGQFIELTVADTGPGVPPLLLDKIFEPYFTTKEVGRGTGMGLAIVHGIVTTMGGFISYTTNSGGGAVFHVYFPAVSGDEIKPIAPPREDLHGSGHILFVDDEPMLVEMGEEMLKRLGYTVTCYSDSSQALKTFLASPERFDAVVTDQTMPGLTGADMAKEMLEARPQIPIILCTGYTNLIDEAQVQKTGIQKFLMKPFSQKNLGEALKEVLQKVKPS